MKTVVRIPLNSNSKISVKVDDEVGKGDIIASLGDEEKELEIILFSILKVKPNEIYKFLKKKPTDLISVGDIIAEKKSFVTTLSVKSPIKGKVKEVDLKKGSITLQTVSDSKTKKIVMPVSGRIIHTGKDGLEVEVKGSRISALSGQGKEVYGELFGITETKNSIFEIDAGVEDKIIISRENTSDMIAKLDTLGAKGLITKHTGAESGFPFLIVSDDVYKNIIKHIGKTVWLRPGQREAILIED